MGNTELTKYNIFEITKKVVFNNAGNRKAYLNVKIILNKELDLHITSFDVLIEDKDGTIYTYFPKKSIERIINSQIYKTYSPTITFSNKLKNLLIKEIEKNKEIYFT